MLCSIKSKIPLRNTLTSNSTIQDMRNDLDTLQGRIDEEIVQDVVKQVITRLMDSLDGNYVMVQKSYLRKLEGEKDVA